MKQYIYSASSAASNLRDAFTSVIWDYLDMGDSFSEFVEMFAEGVGYSDLLDYTDDYGDVLSMLLDTLIEDRSTSLVDYMLPYFTEPEAVEYFEEAIGIDKMYPDLKVIYDSMDMFSNGQKIKDALDTNFFSKL